MKIMVCLPESYDRLLTRKLMQQVQTHPIVARVIGCVPVAEAFHELRIGHVKSAVHLEVP